MSHSFGKTGTLLRVLNCSSSSGFVVLWHTAGVWIGLLRAPDTRGAFLAGEGLRGVDAVIPTGPRCPSHPAHHHLVFGSSQQPFLAAVEEQRYHLVPTFNT